MIRGLTLDAGALIALEARRQRIARVYREAVALGLPVTAPSTAVTEWWRGRTDARDLILGGIAVEMVDTLLAKQAGEALARLRGATLLDAIVMASAARRGDIVYTSDFGDLEKLRSVFPSVRVLSV